MRVYDCAYTKVRASGDASAQSVIRITAVCGARKAPDLRGITLAGSVFWRTGPTNLATVPGRNRRPPTLSSLVPFLPIIQKPVPVPQI
ncbi:hypothetical protein ACLOJK_031380 [Asimina triloba]